MVWHSARWFTNSSLMPSISTPSLPLTGDRILKSRLRKPSKFHQETKTMLAESKANLPILFRELADISPLLEVDDMLMMKDKPDWKCVFCYVQALYRGLHQRTPPSQA